MPAFKDLTGQTFHRLVVLRCTGRNKSGNAIWLCRCVCSGKEVEVRGSSLISGHTASCGCFQRTDLTNQVFGRLTALRGVRQNKQGNTFWLCKCICGNEVEILNSGLVSGNTKSCGCIRRQTPNSLKHGHSVNGPSTTYRSWVSAGVRCTNPNSNRWLNYGGANPPVKICDRWLNSFQAFLDDMGERPEGKTLSRFGDINNYSCGCCEQCRQNGWELNCEWQTWTQQGLEKRIKNQLTFLAA